VDETQAEESERGEMTQLEICAAVMADSQRFELMFQDLNGPADLGRIRESVSRGLRYVGTLLYRNGRTAARLSDESSVAFDVLASATLVFAEVVVARIKRQSQARFGHSGSITESNYQMN
jgi:hypothetical protein